MKSLIKRISPKIAIKRLSTYFKMLKNRSRYYSIIESLSESGEIEKIGFNRIGKNLYIGINLDPTLLRPDYFDDESRNSAELKFISEKLKKYADFLNKQGILDYSIADYDRVYDKSDYYGYVVEIRFNDKDLNRSDLYYGIAYFASLLLLLSGIVWLTLKLAI